MRACLCLFLEQASEPSLVFADALFQIGEQLFTLAALRLLLLDLPATSVPIRGRLLCSVLQPLSFDARHRALALTAVNLLIKPAQLMLAGQ